MVKPRRIGEASAPDITGPLRALPWADRALCAQTDPDLWFDAATERYLSLPNGGREAAAKAICRKCPALKPCRQYAMDNPELEGIWGALTEKDRREWRKRQQRGETA